MSGIRLASASSAISTVTGGGSHGIQPPAFVLPPRNARVALGGDARLEGKVHGHPEPQVTWYKEGRPVIGGERCVVKQSGRGMFSLVMGGVTAEDMGCYTCQATNQAGSRQVTVEILLDENSNKKYGLPSAIKTGCHSAVPAAQSKASIWGESPPRFITKPSRVCAKPGQTVKFSAKTTGRPQPQVSWQRGEAELEAKGRVSIYERSGLHFLEIKEACAEDGGSYTCVVSNSAGSATATAELRLQVSSGESAKTEHQPDMTHCSRLSTSSSLTEQPEVSKEEPPQSHSRSRPAVQLPLVAPRRTATPTKVQSAGNPPSAPLQVVTSGSDHNRSVRKTPPGSDLRFEAVPLNQEATEGAQVTFTCQVSSAAFSAVSWLKDGVCFGKGAAGVEQRQDGPRLTLTMDRVRPKDQGTYRCQLTAEGGATVASSAWILRVNSRCDGQRSKGESRAAGEAPRFVKCLSDLKVMDGSRVTMIVELTGQPPPDVLWLHDGQEVTETEDFQLLREKNRCTLLIQEVFPEDTGTYSCRAHNLHGEASTHARLTVEEPQDGVQPWFITKPKAVSAIVGQHVLLSCAIAGDPFPQFTWRRSDSSRPLTSGGDYELLQKEDVISLLIRRVQKHHAGEYVVSLRNTVGERSAVASLSVTEEGESERSRARRAAGAGDQHSPGAGGVEERSGSAQWQSSKREFKQQGGEEDLENVKEDLGAPRGLLKRSVETRERGEDEIRQREAQQLDFRSLLGRRNNLNNSNSNINTDSVTGQEDKMDFKANLKGVKSKFEDDRKANSTQQVDFRAVLGKKGSPASPSSNAGSKPVENKGAPDFRSVLANKKKAPEKNGETPVKTAEKEKDSKVAVNNCMDGAHHEKKPAAGGGGGGGKGPEFKEKLSDETVLDGQRLRLQCRLADLGGATVTWTLDGKVIKASKFIVLANEGGLCSLTIDKALPEDEGQYKCIAENSTGKSECSCMVLVDDPTENSPADKKSKKATPTSESEARIKKPTPKTPPKQALPPQILQFPEDMKILAGEKVEILCKFSGAPPINCTWLKFRKPIQEAASDISIQSTDSSSKLTISSGQQEHCGCYTVELRNSYGLRQAALNLTIVDKPDPPAKVPAASDIRRASLTLSWYGPTYDGGSAVQSYNLEIWDSLGKEWKHLVSCNSTSYNVQDLLPERQYKFRVRAENIYGVGEPSAESEPVTVGLVDDENQEEAEAEEDDDDADKEPDYRDVTVRTDVKVKDLYDVEERLGTGKFGQVFKLVEKATKKIWAGKFIKVYKAKDKDNVRQEISIMNSLHHAKLVQCVDAFEGKSDIVMVLELISGGELFERIIDEDFELTEREVIKYMLQIIDGVSFIHKQGIVHLDLKPENIMCVNKTGSKIKLIDFGLARRLENAGTLKVLFGTPEFVAPEVINYEAISYPTDMWSIGVICYILLSGLSPFMGDDDNETLSNVTSATWDFEDEAFDEISDNAKDFITNLLKKDMKTRLTCAQCYEHPWLKQDTNTMKAKKLSKERMKKYILRRKWQKTGHAVRAIGRLSSMAMMAGVSAKKGSPTEEDNQFLECLEYEQKAECKPSFSSVIKDVEVVEGSAARFDCKIEGFPDPEVVWYKDEQPIKETRHFQIDYDEEGNCSLVISEVSGDDDAKYTVKAVNSLGEATCTAELLVEVMAGEEEEEEEEEE